MSGYEARCPSCGATIVFKLGSSLMSVCEHCGSAVARKGADLENYGKVAELIPTPSVLALGVEGGYEGAPPFRLVGRLQLDHGAGTWDEWLMGFDNDTWAWLSESQGKFHYMGQAAVPPAPAFEELQVGQTVDLGPPGTFVVTEVRKARFVTGQGELPFDVRPGSELHYADLSGPGGQFGTLDYGTGSSLEALYVGREVSLDEMGVRNLPEAEERRARAAGKSLSCPKCGGPIELQAPDLTQRVACPYCGSLLDATKDLEVLAALDRPKVKPLIPLGSKGTLTGTEWTLIGFMQRSVKVEGIRYAWQEYLLYEPRGGFRWLVENGGHWSFVESANAADVKARSNVRLGVQHKGKLFKHFQSSSAQVDHVLGEFYWAVAQGDKSAMHDYIAPPLILSKEKTTEELTWSLGTYTEPEEIWKGFGLSGDPPERKGVAPNQLWPHKKNARAIYSATLLFLGLLMTLFVVFSITGGDTLHSQRVTIPEGLKSGAPQAAIFSEPFEIKKTGNVQVRVKAPVSNSWLYLDGALIDEKSGLIAPFDVEVSYYAGRDWTEGSTRSSRYISSVPPGTYVMRLAPQWGGRGKVGSYDVTVRSRVPRFYQFFLAGLAIAFFPLMLAWKSFRFEIRRWSESDHPMVESE